jgi:hypothetical protein
LQHDLFPYVGSMLAASIKPRDILGVIQRVEARGATDLAHRMKQMCVQILRYGVAIGWVERDVTPDLKGALIACHRKTSRRSRSRGSLWWCCAPYTATKAILSL